MTLPSGHSKNHKLPVSLGAHGFATKLKQSTDGEKAATQKRSGTADCAWCYEGEVAQLVVALDVLYMCIYIYIHNMYNYYIFDIFHIYI
jgi:hypothetical protein